MELLEELTAEDGEDGLQAELAARSSSVRSFEHRRRTLKAIPSDLPGEPVRSHGPFLNWKQYDQDD
ncbi:hypothetical protein MPL3356_340083 [Mesorhizobium plurifarium]|uniref:Uncharacterized protein n=1 Tax=Mesorhizobium plurifarium TaxID=69974 RepID=A0A090DVA9_MESPL|nr:hypothetical protein MPL3356_340083 [Mesorhizobium plurifarium]